MVPRRKSALCARWTAATALGRAAGIAGGLRAYKPSDARRLSGPGLCEETYVPVPALFARLGISEKFDLEGYCISVQVRRDPVAARSIRPTTTSQGCNLVYTGTPSGSDRVRDAAGAYFTRGERRRTFQFGSLRRRSSWRADAIDAVIGAYVVRYASPNAYYSIIKSTRVGVPQITGNPDGANSGTSRALRRTGVFALTFEKKLGEWGSYGEFSYRPTSRWC